MKSHLIFSSFYIRNKPKLKYINETNFYNCKIQSQNSIIQKASSDLDIKDYDNEKEKEKEKEKNTENGVEKNNLNINNNEKKENEILQQDNNQRNEMETNMNNKLNISFELLSTKKAILEKESSRFNFFRKKLFAKKSILINYMPIINSGKYKVKLI